MSRRVRLSVAARRDIREILAYSLKHFGSEQARTYNARIKKTLLSLRETRTPKTIKARDDIEPGLRSCNAAGRGGRHILFFKIDNDTLDVVRVLHEAMDFPHHLKRQD